MTARTNSSPVILRRDRYFGRQSILVTDQLSKSINQKRRKVIRLLIVMVFAFALLNLPFHGRKLWQHWDKSYRGSTNGAIIFTILTTLFMYLNSGINPFLYALLSSKFRRCFLEVFRCRPERSPQGAALAKSVAMGRGGSTLKARKTSAQVSNGLRSPASGSPSPTNHSPPKSTPTIIASSDFV